MAGPGPGVAVRPALADDLPRLGELAAEARAELADQRGGRLLLTETPCSLDSYLDAPDRSLWAGTVGDAVAGVAAVRVPAGSEQGRFDALYVEPGARRVGVATALLEAGVEWLRGRGCTGVDVSALPGSRATKQFLESAGLVARLIVMQRAI